MTTASPLLELIRRMVEDQQLKDLPDQELLHRFSTARDEAAFCALLGRHGSMVLDVCRKTLGSEDAEDAFQVTFLILARKAGSIRKAASVASWLYGVAYRTALKAQAASARRKRQECRPPGQASETAPDDLTWRETQQIVQAELNRLSQRYRGPLVLCYLEGKTQDEAARLLGVSKAALKKHLERGREVLRARLVRRGLGPTAILAVAAWPSATASAAVLPPLLESMLVTARYAAQGKTAASGVVSDRILQLSEGVMRDMLFSKVKVMAMAFLVCLAGLAIVAVAAAQRSGRDEATKAPAPAVQTKVKALPLPAEALAAHLGVTHQSFELTFDKPQPKVTVSVDVYENGKRVAQGQAVESPVVGKKYSCSVVLSRKEEGKLLMTVVTPGGTFNTLIEDPFGGPGLIYPGPRMDAEGRIPLALKPTKREGGSVNDVTLANAAKALVVQVRKE